MKRSASEPGLSERVRHVVIENREAYHKGNLIFFR